MSRPADLRLAHACPCCGASLSVTVELATPPARDTADQAMADRDARGIADAAAAILPVLEEYGPLSANAVQRIVRRRRQWVRSGLRALVASGRVDPTPEGFAAVPGASEPVPCAAEHGATHAAPAADEPLAALVPGRCCS